MMEVLKVSSSSNPNKVAGAIVGELLKHDRVELQAIGAGAVNQSVKAVAIARRFISEQNKDLFMIPGFQDVSIDGDIRTAISIKICATDKENENEVAENETIEEEDSSGEYD